MMIKSTKQAVEAYGALVSCRDLLAEVVRPTGRMNNLNAYLWVRRVEAHSRPLVQGGDDLIARDALSSAHAVFVQMLKPDSVTPSTAIWHQAKAAESKVLAALAEGRAS